MSRTRSLARGAFAGLGVVVLVAACSVSEKRFNESLDAGIYPVKPPPGAGGSSGDPTALPKLELEPAALGFGPVALGFAARDTLSVRNTGTGPMQVPAIDLLAGSDTDFTILQNQCEEPLPAGEQCDVRLTLLPSKLGDIAGSLQVSALEAGDQTAALSGSGLAGGELLVGPAPGSAFDFGGVRLSSSATGVFRVTNPSATVSGPLTLSLSNPDFVAAPAAVGECVSGVTSLANGESCDIRVAFTPSRRARRENTLTVASEGVGAVSAALSGRGLAPAALGVSSESVNFQQVALGASAAATLRVENSGDEPLTLGGLTLSGDNVEDFSIQSSDCAGNTVLPGGESCSATLQFRPVTMAGNRSALVGVQSAASGALSVALAGEALPPSRLLLAPFGAGAADFGPVRLGEAKVQTFQVTNPGDQPSGTLAINAASDFTVLTPPEPGECEPGVTTLVNGESCTVRVSFAPTARSPRAAALFVVSPLAGGTSLALSGAGVIPARLSVVQGELNFGRIVVGDAASGIITVMNRGDEPLSPPTATLVNVSREQSEAFAVVNGCAGELAYRATCEIALTYRPSEPLPYWGTLRLASTSGGAASALLLGEAVARGSLVLAAATGSSSDFGDVEVNTTATRQFSISNPGAEASGRLTISVTGGDGSFVVDEGDCNPQGSPGLSDNQSCTFGVSFRPTISGAANANISVGSPGAGSVGLQISGRGRNPASLSATANRDFGTANIGQEAITEPANEFTWTVTNDGDLASGTLLVTNSNMAEFATTGDTCANANLAAQSTCQMSIRFRASATGARTGSLSVVDQTSMRALRLEMTGNGVQIAGPGQSCINATCGEGTCTGGVCCDRQCNGTCQVCSSSGQCLDQSGRETCGNGSGLCFGVNRCLLPERQPCSGDNQCGDGQCEARLGGTSLNDRICCLEDCGTTQQCNPQTGRCQVPTLDQGVACGAPGQASCGTGLTCRDGVCCNGACNGVCEVCNTQGTCVAEPGASCGTGLVCGAARGACGCPPNTRDCGANRCIPEGALACCSNAQCASLCTTCSGNACTPVAVGAQGRCAAGLRCNAAGACAACLNDGDCGDGRACNGAERCVAGACQAGTAVSCPSPQNCTASCTESATGARCVVSAIDSDRDGFGSVSCADAPGTDCNDGNGNISPAAAEICDGIDNDCDTLIDLRDGLTVAGTTRPITNRNNVDVGFLQGSGFRLVGNAGDASGIFFGTLNPTGTSTMPTQLVDQLLGVTSYFQPQISGGAGGFLVTYGVGNRGGGRSTMQRFTPAGAAVAPAIELQVPRQGLNAAFRTNDWLVVDGSTVEERIGRYNASNDTYVEVLNPVLTGSTAQPRIAINGNQSAIVYVLGAFVSILTTAADGIASPPFPITLLSGGNPDVTAVNGGFAMAVARDDGFYMTIRDLNGISTCQSFMNQVGNGVLTANDAVAIANTRAGVVVLLTDESFVRLFLYTDLVNCGAPAAVTLRSGVKASAPSVAVGNNQLALAWTEELPTAFTSSVRVMSDRLCQ